MNRTVLLLIGITLVGTASFASGHAHKSVPRTTAPIVEVPFTAVHLNDIFWSPRIEINRTVSIPSAFRECEKNGRFDNFAIAAGLMKGEHRGDFSFDDTDPTR